MNQKVIIIGSGFGALGAAARLAARGYDVEIFEKRDKPGGRAYVYEQDGFKFDGGHGGHNGLRDIIAALGNNRGFHRLRIGIGHPGAREQVSPHVLSRPSPATLRGMGGSAILVGILLACVVFVWR